MSWATGEEPIPGYRLIRRIGRGGFGEVWRAYSPGNFEVALKAIPLVEDEPIAEESVLELFKKLRHANLVATFATWKTDYHFVVAMELADGTLMDRYHACLKDGRGGIPRAELLEYFGDAAKALDYLNEPRHDLGGGHLQGIQHRDIKPQNMLLFGGTLKVADYGLARILASSRTGHSGSLTPHYAAPEFFTGVTSDRSDQYSLAVSYCQMRGGKLPFGEELPQILYGHAHGAPDLGMLPEGERPIVGRALAKSPDERWPSCREFVRQLERAGSTPGAGQAMIVEETVAPDHDAVGTSGDTATRQSFEMFNTGHPGSAQAVETGNPQGDSLEADQGGPVVPHAPTLSVIEQVRRAAVVELRDGDPRTTARSDVPSRSTRMEPSKEGANGDRQEDEDPETAGSERLGRIEVAKNDGGNEESEGVLGFVKRNPLQVMYSVLILVGFISFLIKLFF